MKDFFQTPPELKNQFTDDQALQDFLRWRLPKSVMKSITPQLNKMGERAITDIMQMGLEAEAQLPVLVNYSPWGERIDEIRVSQGWKNLEKVAAEEGIVACGYMRKFGEYSRLFQAALLYLYHPSSAIFSCPLAMTDGAARVMEVHGKGDIKRKALSHLTTRDPKKFWTSGQWMTEKTGGSDVSQTMTVAKKVGDHYELYGTKWFTSATTSQMAMALGRIEGAEEGNRGLSLFFIETRDENGKLNKLEINRLKDKLGTKALPTAELTLKGTKAYLIGEEGRGVKNIATLFNITRLYNSVCAVGYMRRAYALALDYSEKRKAFGKKLVDHPLHWATLEDMRVELVGNLFFTFHVMHLQGKEDTKKISDHDRNMHRLLTPVLKLYTAKKAVGLVSEVVECFGGAGYCEDTGIPKLLRDTQTLAIWEGTTNVLSLDMLRSMEKENTFPNFIYDVRGRLERVKNKKLNESKAHIDKALKKLEVFAGKAMKKGPEYMQLNARKFAFSVARIFTASLLLEFAQANANKQSIADVEAWISEGLYFLKD